MQSKDNRNLLYFNQSNNAPLMVYEMEGAGWDVKIANNVDAATHIIDRYAPQVALAQLE